MERAHHRHGAALRTLFLAVFLVAPTSATHAQMALDGVPANARANSYGNGWRCDDGFRDVNGACVAIKVPAHAYGVASSYGKGWE